jgi:hypothetical protein
MINAEMVTAFSVFLGALFGGIVAVMAELRKPEPHSLGRAPDTPGADKDDEDAVKALTVVVREEADHINRTIWIVEKKLSDHLHRLEIALAAIRGEGHDP